jgi:hypothetical protein
MTQAAERLHVVVERLLADGWQPAGQTAQTTFRTHVASGPGNLKQITTGGRLRFSKGGCTLTVGKRTLFIWGKAKDRKIAMADGVTLVIDQVNSYLAEDPKQVQSDG